MNWFWKKKQPDVEAVDLIARNGRVIVPDDVNNKFYEFKVIFDEPVSIAKVSNAVLTLGLDVQIKTGEWIDE